MQTRVAVDGVRVAVGDMIQATLRRMQHSDRRPNLFTPLVLDTLVTAETRRALLGKAGVTAPPSSGTKLLFFMAPSAADHARWTRQCREVFRDVRALALYRVSHTSFGFVTVKLVADWRLGDMAQLKDATLPGHQLGLVHALGGGACVMGVGLEDLVARYRVSQVLDEVGTLVRPPAAAAPLSASAAAPTLEAVVNVVEGVDTETDDGSHDL